MQSFAETFQLKHRAISKNVEEPPLLFRYRSCATPYFETEMERLLLRDELFFPNQPQLNDPFDCQPVIEKGVSFRDFRRQLFPILCTLRAVVSRELGALNASDVDLRRIIRHMIETETIDEQRTLYDSRLYEMMARGLADTCVLSLANDKANSVMWSMYANKGDGVCLEFTQLCIARANSLDRSTELLGATKVRYVRQRPVFNYYGAVALFLGMTEEATGYLPKRYHRHMLEGLEQSAFLWTKEERWSYEGEYRLILSRPHPHVGDPAGEYVPIGPRCLSGIYLGDGVTDKKASWLIGTAKLRRRKVAIYRGRRASSSFGLQFEPEPSDCRPTG